MAGGDLARAHGVRHLQKLVELDEVVAERAGNRRAPGQVLVDERPHHLLLEAVLEIHHVIRDADLPGHAARIVDVVERAAAAGRAFRARSPAAAAGSRAAWSGR